MDFEGIVPSEISQTGKDNYNITYTQNFFLKDELIETEQKIYCQGLGDEGNRMIRKTAQTFSEVRKKGMYKFVYYPLLFSKGKKII